MARRERALRRQEVPRRLCVASRDAASRRGCRSRRRRRDAGTRAAARLLRSRLVGRRRDRGHIRAGRTHHRQQLAQLPHGIRRSAADSGSERRSSRAAEGPGGARLEGTHRHQPQLLDRRAVDGARASAPVRSEQGDDHDAAGDFRRGISRRAVVGHPRQRNPVHRRRGAQDRNRNEEDSRLHRRSPHRSASGRHQRPDDARGGAERAHRIDLRRIRSPAVGRGSHRRVDVVEAARRPSLGAGAADRVLARAQPSPACARRRPWPRHDGHHRAAASVSDP